MSFPFPVVPIFSERRGDGYAASQALKAGAVLLKVWSPCTVVKSGLEQSVCCNCFEQRRPGLAMTGCKSCGRVVFCARCRALTRPAARHADECAAIAQLAATNKVAGCGNADTTAVRLLIRLMCFRRAASASAGGLESVAWATGPEDGECAEDDVISDGAADLEDLMGAAEDLPDDLVVKYNEVSKQARFLAPAWARTGLGAALRLMVQSHFNGFDVTAPAADDDDPQSVAQGATVGEGVFSSAARLNHSCSPNCRLRFRGGCLVLTAARGIKKGEELLITYVNSAAPVADRRRELSGVYRFDCDCERCQKDLKVSGQRARGD